MALATPGEVMIRPPSTKVGENRGPRMLMSTPSEGPEKLRAKVKTTKVAKAGIKDNPGDHSGSSNQAIKEAAKAIKAGCMETKEVRMEKVAVIVGKKATSQHTAPCRRCATTAAVSIILATTARSDRTKPARERENLAKQGFTISSRVPLKSSQTSNKMEIKMKRARLVSTLYA